MGVSSQKTLEHYERRCPCCGRVFYIQSLALYTYKIRRVENSRKQIIDYYCKYSCFTKGQIILDKNKAENKIAGEKHWTKRKGNRDETAVNEKRGAPSKS